MTAPKPASTTKTAAKKATPAKAAPAEKPAAAPAPAPAKAADKPAAAAKLLPATPGELTFAPKSEKDPTPMAVGAKYTYRIQEGASGGFFASLRTTTGGKWVNVAGRCETVEQAQKLAGWAEGGAFWLTYAKFQGVPFATVVENHTATTATDAK